MSLIAIRVTWIESSLTVASRGTKTRPSWSFSTRPISKRIYELGFLQHRTRSSTRSFSTSRALSKDAAATAVYQTRISENFRARQQEAAESIRPILNELPGEIDLAVAYGSGVMKQANPTGPPPMIDLLLATPSSVSFHTANLKLNPTHYPTHARVFGPNWVNRIQGWGAGAWYIPQVTLAGKNIKYGVVSTSTLLGDLQHWDTFYFAGRFQKPTVTLKMAKTFEDDFHEAVKKNDTAALALALCLIPESTFPEIELWEKIAGLSYTGDPRMGLGAENPDKVKNIVRGPGALDGFREKYGPLLRLLEVEPVDQSLPKGPSEWEGQGEAILERPDSPSILADTIAKLPGAMINRVEGAGPDDQTQTRRDLLRALQRISGPPALRQSIKGLLTAGLGKSITYGLAKLQKGSAGRKS